MSAEHDVIVIGGGNAGLSLSKYLKDDGVDHVVLERDRVAHAWRDERWDSFCLVTPNWQCRLPDFPYNGSDPEGFMRKDEIVDYIEAFAASFGPPLREGVDVRSVRPSPFGGFDLATTAGPLRARSVVIATGGYQGVTLPPASKAIDQSIVQVHSSRYRSPSDLPEGDVLVVGSGQSGSQIAEDLHLAGRRVHLCTGSAPRVSRRYRGRDVVAWLDDLGYYDLDVAEHPLKEGIRARPNHYVTGRDGGHDIDLRAFARAGMQLYGRLTDARDGKLFFGDDLVSNLASADKTMESIKDTIDAHIAKNGIDAPTEARYRPVWEPENPLRELTLAGSGIVAIVWCVGFKTRYDWVEAPDAFDEAGRPKHRRGVTAVPDLYFLGLPWLYTWGSGRFCGVARDARYLADHIGRRSEVSHTVEVSR
jgi:putative flavoprotein involved in K+ transport